MIPSAIAFFSAAVIAVWFQRVARQNRKNVVMAPVVGFVACLGGFLLWNNILPEMKFMLPPLPSPVMFFIEALALVILVMAGPLTAASVRFNLYDDSGPTCADRAVGWLTVALTLLVPLWLSSKPLRQLLSIGVSPG